MSGEGLYGPPVPEGFSCSCPLVAYQASATGRLVHELVNNSPVLIDPGLPNTVTSQIQVGGTGGMVSDVNVSVDIAHTYNADLIVTLISPTGTRVELFNGVGGSTNNFTNTTLDDEATVPIGAGAAPFTGVFQPQQSLSQFGGEDPHGTWTLEIQDIAFQDGGALKQWSLELVTNGMGVSDDALVAYWDFNDAQGETAADQSNQGENHTAQLLNGADWNAFGLDGALSLDGRAGMVSVPSSSNLNLKTIEQRTISLWFYAGDASLQKRQVLYEEGAHVRGLNVYLDNGHVYVGGWNVPEEETGWSGTYLSTPVDSGRWHHVALVLDAVDTVSDNALTGYLDGQAFGQGAGSMILPHSGDIGIGKINGNTLFHDGVRKAVTGFSGLIDEVRVYNRALSPGEIASLASLSLADPDTSSPQPPPPPPTSEFTIEVRFTDTSLSDEYQTIFQSAADRWSQIILGDIPDIMTSIGLVDDIVIDARGVFIDGQGGILGSAGPTQLRPGSFLPARGSMQFDLADLDNLVSNGSLEDVILHEMAHVIGIGTIWSSRGLLQGAGTSNPVFIGAAAQAEYAEMFGLSDPTPVPVANTGGGGTRDSHWRESVFGNELLTGYLNSGSNPISRVTIASLADIGYEVDLDAADAYTPPGLLTQNLGILSGPASLPGGDLDDEIVLRPATVVLPEESLV